MKNETRFITTMVGSRGTEFVSVEEFATRAEQNGFTEFMLGGPVAIQSLLGKPNWVKVSSVLKAGIRMVVLKWEDV